MGWQSSAGSRLERVSLWNTPPGGQILSRWTSLSLHGGLIPLEISNKLLCLFSADVTEAEGGYVVEVPRREVETGSVEPGENYRVALITAAAEDTQDEEDERPERRTHDEPQPPVEPGEIRYVEIEDIGKQGDGIARVERGYVIIVPDADIGERVKIEVTEVKSNFAVGEIIEGM